MAAYGPETAGSSNDASRRSRQRQWVAGKYQLHPGGIGEGQLRGQEGVNEDGGETDLQRADDEDVGEPADGARCTVYLVAGAKVGGASLLRFPIGVGWAGASSGGQGTGVTSGLGSTGTVASG
jgi:hypothetical protein